MSEQRAMTVLGFIGSHIIGQLLETEVELPYGFERGSNAQALTSDYTEALQRVDVVTHCANPILVKETNPEVMLRGTVDSALHLVKQALDVGVKKMVYCSSLSLHFFDLNRKAAFGATPLTTEDFCSVPLDGEIIKLEGHSDGTMYQLPKAVVERKLGEIAKANLGVEIMTIVPATVFVPFVHGLFASNHRTYIPNPTGHGMDAVHRVYPDFHLEGYRWDHPKRTTEAGKKLANRVPPEDAECPAQTCAPLDDRSTKEALGLREYVPWERTIVNTVDACLEEGMKQGLSTS
uniref:NAD-dependent epimerase/dehydratase domain-containing protein n=1 Tax=Moniliophthora roreri TaxID=221103 RepID=A0A0W0G1Z2_MONRR